MTPERWQRLKPLYNAALDLSQGDRDDFVERTCAAEPELAAELRALIAADVDSDHAFASPLGDLLQSLAAPPATLPTGTLLAGRFRLVRHIGSGGMGDVYEALDEQMEGSRIALKTIRPSLAENAVALARFKDEVRLARKISGPNVCRIHELYQTPLDREAHCSAFLTMELLEGITLHDRISGGTAMAPKEIERLFEQLCTGLGCIHQAGIVHGDLKPRNVMLVPQGGGDRVVVTDFGLARGAVHATSDTRISAAGPIAGTPSYMAPEQFEGREVGPSTDIYALGLILYEMATGVEPFAAHTPLAAAIRRSRPPANASSLRTDLPPAWDSVITRCLCYDAGQRFGSTDEVLLALRHPGQVAVRVGRRRRVLVPTSALLASALAFVLLACSALWLLVGRTRHRELAPDAAHWYTLGMTALREGSYMKATRLLAMVTARDPTYALAHAALADAWTELDSTESAQREMLLASAPDEQRGLNEMERRYIDAVRTTLIRDYSAAAQDYEAILTRLPAENKAQGYVDLGRIYEKAGRVKETVSSYEKAASLNKDDPAPFLHLGILKSRLRDLEAAATAFDHADSLYGAESDQEGLAEVAYQRGYAANEANNTAQAKQYFKKSLSIAQQIPSPQMEVRSLSQLSSVAYYESKDDEAAQYANDSMRIAQERGLEYWMSDGLIRLADAHMDHENFAAAEPLLQQALFQSRQNGHPRLEAFASLNLASLRDQEHRPNEQITYAQNALKYYQDYGFLGPADKALLLIVRGELARGNYPQALLAGNRLLATAYKSQSAQIMALGEEMVGGVLLYLERFPDALAHFQQALELAHTQHTDPAYQEVHCAEALWHLGRYDEATEHITSVSPEKIHRLDLGPAISSLQADMHETRGEAQAAFDVSDGAIRHFAKAGWDDGDLQLTRARAELQLGRTSQAQKDATALHAESLRQDDARHAFAANTLLSEISLRTGDFEAAKALAKPATDFFASEEMNESEALGYLLQARIAEASEDMQGANVLSQKSLDIFRRMEQSWGKHVFKTYLARPDLIKDTRDLAKLRGIEGAAQDELF